MERKTVLMVGMWDVCTAAPPLLGTAGGMIAAGQQQPKQSHSQIPARAEAPDALRMDRHPNTSLGVSPKKPSLLLQKKPQNPTGKSAFRSEAGTALRSIPVKRTRFQPERGTKQYQLLPEPRNALRDKIKENLEKIQESYPCLLQGGVRGCFVLRGSAHHDASLSNHSKQEGENFKLRGPNYYCIFLIFPICTQMSIRDAP